MKTLGGVDQDAELPPASWTLAAELACASPAVDEDIRTAVTALLPAGAWTEHLAGAIADSVFIAMLYAHRRRGAGAICLQCYRRTAGLLPPKPSCAEPASPCGWSYFLVERSAPPIATLPSATTVIQIYLFHE